jgi:hypothetical protein
MPVYTVHAPKAAAADRPLGSADRFVFIRDGFHGWAFVAGLFWLAYHRLWLVLTGMIAALAVLTVVFSALHVDAGARMLVLLLIALLLGFEGASLWRWTLSRRGWRQLDIVVADDEDTAERRFFDRWNAQHPGRQQPPVDRGAPPPPRSGPTRSASPSNDIVGLFPWPGASR